ncbi:hypothetical protein KGF54_001073 [Candida jiufengensis]|uniref:uncharacterized protein n=1 Tax=Candida jiufengensis TaxID=497108 RepID=UPI00222469F5|nr:uncharacterized protein KGF54_001073 [Candida jiufengensis]KAI5956598.1 hypothetical protein KGF54_001073 [Candida jiufengensis]
MPSREASPSLINGNNNNNNHQHHQQQQKEQVQSPQQEQYSILDSSSSSLYKSPTTKLNRLNVNKNLTIQVPRNEEQQDIPLQHPSIKSLNSLLGEPLNFDNSNISSSITNSIKSMSPNNFPRITQLPTPVLKNGSFSNYSHDYQQQQQQQQQQILSSPPKDRSSIELSRVRSIQSPRVISDYKPIARVNSLNSNHNNNNNTNKRVTSNPTTIPSSTSINSTPFDQPHTIDSPITPSTSPLLSEESKFITKKYYSKRLNFNFSFNRILGKGNFSQVILADGIAIKILSMPDSKSQFINFKSFIIRELSILYNVSHHPCITSLLDYTTTFPIQDIKSGIEDDTVKIEEVVHGDQLIFMNYCQGGNLLQFLLNHNQSMNINNLNYWILMKRIISELILTTTFLHKQDIIHRDIKLENVLLLYTVEEIDQIFNYDEIMITPIINLSDFGLSKKLSSSDQLLETRCGSVDYISPEIIMGVPYNGKLTDTWAVGVLIYSILEGNLPFSSNNTNKNSTNTGISPSVLKRRNSKKNSINHRIAMIDWCWNNIDSYLSNSQINSEILNIFQDLKQLVEIILVRKDRRPTLDVILNNPDFQWIKENVPKELLDYI